MPLSKAKAFEGAFFQKTVQNRHSVAASLSRFAIVEDNCLLVGPRNKVMPQTQLTGLTSS
jgi:hypothetical protein